MAKRKAPARRRSGAAPKRAAARAVTPKRRAAARKVGARKATARKTARKAAKARPAAKRSAKKAVKRAAPKASARVVRRLVKKAAPKAAARKPSKKLVKVVKAKVVKKAAAKPSPAPARAVAPKPKAAAAAAASAGKKKHALGLDRARRIVQDDDDIVSPTPPSSLNLDRTASSARSGRQELRERYDKHTETSPALTGGDVDADWESAYSTGDEAPGGDNPTPDQNNVDDIGLALGVEYEDNEELEGADKIVERDRHRWEDDPASSEDFEDR
jgi:hypothetical protein